MTIASTSSAAERSPHRSSFPLALKLAMRELRGGISGFYIFIACVALGVMVITGVGALSDALRAGLERQGEAILGGDVTLSRTHARSEGAERGWITAAGRVSETATLRTMARKTDGSDQSLAELKAVDKAYPLVGAVRIAAGAAFEEAVHAKGGAAVDPILLERLSLRIGDEIMVGKARIRILATIGAEPDQLTDRLTYGPRVIVSHDTLTGTGLVQPGSLIRWRYALKLSETDADTADVLKSFRERLKSAVPESGFTVLDLRDPSPQVSRTLERLRQFLTLLGLTALLIGGVGVANAVATFIDRRRKVIATMKSLGAPSRLVLGVFLAQVLVMAAVGVLIGVVTGYAVPSIVSAVFGDAIPIPAIVTVTGRSILLAVAFGVLVTLLFSLWPLGRAERVSPAVLFRDEVSSEHARPHRRIVLSTVAVGALLVALIFAMSDSRMIALYFTVALAVLFAVFLVQGVWLQRLARRMKRPRHPELALAVGNIGSPGGLTRSVVLSLGAGLTLLVAISLTDAAFVRELKSRLPEQSPSYFLLDIAKEDYPAVTDLVQREAPGATMSEAPMLRGRLVRLNETPAEEVKAAPEATWVLTGDRGLSYSEAVPDGSRLIAGQWWDKDYAGEPLVSFEAELARKLGLKLGDSVTVNVLGRNVTARISSLRHVDWESLAINFVMVFSPNTLKAAPHNLLATVTLPKDASADVEGRLARQLGKAFPSVTAIRVKDAIDTFNRVFEKIMVAVRVASGVTLLAGALVLAGALATAQRRRVLQAVILKTLGATRRRILVAHAAEYLILAAATAAIAVVLGSLAAYIALTSVLDVPFTLSASAIVLALAVSAGLILLFGGVGTLSVLRARPVPYLRTE